MFTWFLLISILYIIFAQYTGDSSVYQINQINRLLFHVAVDRMKMNARTFWWTFWDRTKSAVKCTPAVSTLKSGLFDQWNLEWGKKCAKSVDFARTVEKYNFDWVFVRPFFNARTVAIFSRVWIKQTKEWAFLCKISFRWGSDFFGTVHWCSFCRMEVAQFFKHFAHLRKFVPDFRFSRFCWARVFFISLWLTTLFPPLNLFSNNSLSNLNFFSIFLYS